MNFIKRYAILETGDEQGSNGDGKRAMLKLKELIAK